MSSVEQPQNYGWLSTANGIALTLSDDDGMSGDCVLWHQSGYGGVSHSHGKLTVSGSTEQNGSARFYETASNLL